MSVMDVEDQGHDRDVVSGALAPIGDAGQLAVKQSLAVSLARAEIDQQIATARAMPRNIKRVVNNILSLATLDEETAEECVYAVPRGGKPIKGPSVRLAEIIYSMYGNCRVGARVIHVDRFEKYVEAEGVFHDLETNAATTARVRRRIFDKDGRVFNDDMIVVTGNAACAIAKRNAILGAVPKAVWRRAYQAVESVIAGDIKTLVERRERAMKAFAAFGVKPEQVFAAVGVSTIDDVTIEHMSTLTGMHSALKSGEATVEEMFPAKPDQQKTGEAPKGIKEKLEGLVGNVASNGNGGAKEPTQQQPTPPHDPKTGEIIERGSEVVPNEPVPSGENVTTPLRTENQSASGGADPLEIPAVLLRKPHTPGQLSDWATHILDSVKSADNLPHAWEKIEAAIDGNPALKQSYEDMLALYRTYERKLEP